VYSEGKPVVGPMKIEKGKSFYTEIKITGMWAFSEVWRKHFKEPAAEEDAQMEYSSD
jgi:hypothetical protein